MYAEATRVAVLNRHLWAVKRFQFGMKQCLFSADYEVLIHAVVESHNEIVS
jgi:hypothetical protein